MVNVNVLHANTEQKVEDSLVWTRNSFRDHEKATIKKGNMITSLFDVENVCVSRTTLMDMHR